MKSVNRRISAPITAGSACHQFPCKRWYTERSSYVQVERDATVEGLNRTLLHRSLHPRGLHVLLPKSYADVPAEPQKFWLSLYHFLPKYPPISIPFSIEKHPILPKLGAVCNHLLKIYPVFEFGLLHLWWIPIESVYQILGKSISKTGTYTYTMSMLELSPSQHCTPNQNWGCFVPCLKIINTVLKNYINILSCLWNSKMALKF